MKPRRTLPADIASLAAAMSMALTASPALASSHMHIVKCDGARTWKDCAIIAINGAIEEPDAAEFRLRVKEIKTARVDLSSLGGSFSAGVEIGEAVYAKKFDTNVTENATCASACANIWLAGKNRASGPGSVLLFHVPFHQDDPQHADGVASVIQGVCLAEIGYSYTDALRLFGHGPHNVEAFVSDQSGVVREMSCETDAHDAPIDGTCN